MPSERWSWDPVSRRYRDGNSGRFLSHEKIARIRNDYAATHRQWADDLASNLASRDLTVARWELEMRGRLKSVYLSQYMLGRGGKNAMTQADYGRVGRMLVDQYGYLRTFATDLTTGTLSVAQIGARMQLYFESAVQAFERGKAVAYDADLILPAYPGDGRTDCRARCKCRWRITETKTEFRCYWTLGKAEHCAGCLDRRARYSPFIWSKSTS